METATNLASLQNIMKAGTKPARELLKHGNQHHIKRFSHRNQTCSASEKAALKKKFQKQAHILAKERIQKRMMKQRNRVFKLAMDDPK